MPSPLIFEQMSDFVPETGRVFPAESVIEDIAISALAAPDAEKDKAALFGTRAHSIFEHIIRDNLSTFPCSCELRPSKDAFLDWREHVAKRAQLHVEQSEVPIYSPTHGYAGTMDALATMPKVGSPGQRSLVVLDWKTSNSMRVEYAWQVAAYIRAYEELTGQKIDDAFLVRLAKDSGDFEVRRLRDIEAAFQGFLACLSVYKAVNEPNSYFT